MSTYLQQTDQTTPLAQSFKINEPEGAVITGIGLFFAGAPSVTDAQLPITIELRPLVDAGVPSSRLMYKGTRVSASASAIRAVSSTSFSSATEYKFTFDHPIYLETNTEVAVCIRSNAPAGKYKIWYAKLGEFVNGSTTTRISSTIEAGSYFATSSGTTWTPDQQKDLSLKVYRAKFTYDKAFAALTPDYPEAQKLTTNTLTDNIMDGVKDPLVFTSGSGNVSVIHPHHGFQVGQKVTLTSTSYDSGDTINGISGANLLGTKTITAVDPYGYTFNSGGTATATARGGGNGIFASHQNVADAIRFNMVGYTPPNGNAVSWAKMPTYKSFAGSTPVSKFHENLNITSGEIQFFKEPHYVANETQVNDDADLKTTIFTMLETQSAYTAPHIDLEASSIETFSHFIDYQDSASTTGRNVLSTIPFVPETAPSGGTTASKYISVPYKLEVAATSIRVYVDAVRPTTGDFSVWYRTNNTSSSSKIEDKEWVEFSKTSDGPNKSNYEDIAPVDAYAPSEYEFNVYDINSFDQYQIKITMNNTNSAKLFSFENLRTIATV
jgi:hypothetical protein